MKPEIDAVKISRRYHHGHLRQALLDAALQVLAEKGVEGFSLRETARRAGVSPAAPKHHFPDTRALLTALATSAFGSLADRLEAADAAGGKSRAKRVRAQGIAYVDFALQNHAVFDLMWRVALLDLRDSTLLREKTRAFTALDALVRGPARPTVQGMDPSMAPTVACWALVHGFARLALDGAFGPTPLRARAAVEKLLVAMIDRLRV